MAAFNLPKLSLIKFLNSLDSWKIVIIGCNKNNDYKWKSLDLYTDKIIYLSIYKQIKLDYKINKYLDLNSYSRKNIGYLYAIHHGAKEIYEIDENINISNIDMDNIINNTEICYGLRNDYEMINPYTYFGDKYIWPRGFKIKDIGKGYNNKFYSMKYNQLILKPLIFQGLINGRPDLDSIFFSSKINKALKYDFTLFKYKPILYLPGNYVPINSKNTKYLYEIFPFLVLPSTVNSKISDILRGYILQRFLWGYNGIVVYHSTSAYYDENISLAYTDLINEKYLYYKLDSFLKELNIENYIKYIDPIKIFINLIKNLIKKDFFGEKDLYLYNAYLEDLLNIGYNKSFNFINSINSNYRDYLKIDTEFSIYFPLNPIILINNSIYYNSIKLINHYIATHKYNDILLIINYNHIGFQKLNNYIIKLYKQYFNNIVFIMPADVDENYNIISCNNSYYGYYSYICFKKLYNEYPNFKGYLYINDDVFVKIWELENLDFNIPWLYNFHIIDKKNWIHYDNCKKIYNILNQNLEWKMNLTKFVSIFDIPVTTADFYYLPNTIVPNYLKIIEEIYNKSKLFLECAVPSSFGIFLSHKYQIIYFQGLWGKTREKAIDYLIKDFKQITIHPIKFSNIFLKNEVNLYIFFINAIDY